LLLFVALIKLRTLPNRKPVHHDADPQIDLLPLRRVLGIRPDYLSAVVIAPKGTMRAVSPIMLLAAG
jgi:hypothetical protein